MFSGSFGVRSIVLCKCSGKVLIGYEIFRQMSLTLTLPLDVPVHPMDVKGLSIIF